MSDDPSEEATAMLRDIGRIPIQDVFVDVLGSLVPGILYAAAILPALVLPLDALVRRLSGGTNYLVNLQWLAQVSPSGAVVAVLFGVVATYVLGHLFFRQTPAAADESSWQCLKARGDETDHPGPYPYNNLPKQLQDRGLSYLAMRVPWSASGPRNPTKHFINALKIRLTFSHPGRVGTIVRNEAHIRLSASLWHVCRSLVRPCVAGLVCGVAANSVYKWQAIWPLPPSDLMAVVRPALVLVGTWRVRAAIERTLHYQRRREIFFILETADWAQRNWPDVNIFSGLEATSGEGRDENPAG